MALCGPFCTAVSTRHSSNSCHFGQVHVHGWVYRWCCWHPPRFSPRLIAGHPRLSQQSMRRLPWPLPPHVHQEHGQRIMKSPIELCPQDFFPLPLMSESAAVITGVSTTISPSTAPNPPPFPGPRRDNVNTPSIHWIPLMKPFGAQLLWRSPPTLEAKRYLWV